MTDNSLPSAKLIDLVSKFRLLPILVLTLFLSSETSGRPPAETIIANYTETELRAALANGGTVRFSRDGVIHLAGPIQIARSVTVDASGHSIILEGSGTHRLFEITNQLTARFRQITFRKGVHIGASGTAFAPAGPGFGGAFYLQAGTLDLQACKLVENRADGGPAHDDMFAFGGDALGGAVFVETGSLYATDCVFENNSAAASAGGSNSSGSNIGQALGGAIYNEQGQVTLVRSVFAANRLLLSRPYTGSVVGGNAEGGALVNAGKLVLDSCLFTGHAITGWETATRGGVLLNLNEAAIFRSRFASNHVLGASARIGRRSGGIGAGGAIYNSGALTIESSTFDHNESQGGPANTAISGGPGTHADARGGAIASESSLSITNSTFFANIARGGPYDGGYPGKSFGGAIYSATGAELAIVHSSFAQNVAVQTINPLSEHEAFGGALFSETNSATHVINSLFSMNSPESTLGPLIDLGHNLTSDSSPAFTHASSITGTDPLLAPFGFHGGPTPTLPLAAISPAIDRANPVSGLNFDQRGFPRPHGHPPDIGAYEYHSYRLELTSTGNTPSLQFFGLPNQAYELQASADLNAWAASGFATTDSTGSATFSLERSATASFFRIQLPSL